MQLFYDGWFDIKLNLMILFWIKVLRKCNVFFWFTFLLDACSVLVDFGGWMTLCHGYLHCHNLPAAT